MKRDVDILKDGIFKKVWEDDHSEKALDPLPAREENAVLAKLAACVAEFNRSHTALMQVLEESGQDGYSPKYSPRGCLMEMQRAMYTIAEEAYRQQMKRVEVEDGEQPDNYLVLYFLKEIGEI